MRLQILTATLPGHNNICVAALCSRLMQMPAVRRCGQCRGPWHVARCTTLQPHRGPGPSSRTTLEALRWRYCCDARSTAVLRATAVLPTTAVLSITAVVSTAVIGVLSTTTPPPLCCPRPLCSPPPQCSGPSARWPVWRAAALTTGGHMVQTLHAAQMPHGAIVYSVGAVGTWCPTVQVQHA